MSRDSCSSARSRPGTFHAAPESTVQSLTDEYRSVTTQANDAILASARHAGHMDILRELIDGATGR